MLTSRASRAINKIAHCVLKKETREVASETTGWVSAMVRNTATGSWRLCEQVLNNYRASTFQLYDKLPMKGRREDFNLY